MAFPGILSALTYPENISLYFSNPLFFFFLIRDVFLLRIMNPPAESVSIHGGAKQLNTGRNGQDSM